MLLTLIITAHKQSTNLKCILGLLELVSDSNLEIIVTEDGQDPDTLKVVAAYSNSLRIQHISQEHTGMRRSRILNAALRIASGDYIIFLDGDCIPQRHFLTDHRKLAEHGYFIQGRRAYIKEPSVDRFIKHPTPFSFLKLWFKGQASGFYKGFRLPWGFIKQNRELKGTLGCNIAAWKADLYAVNGFDEAFEGWGREDSDLIARLYVLGLKRKFVHAHCVVYHLNHPKLPPCVQNNSLLEAALQKNSLRCAHGIELDASIAHK
jgi:glycosyltransferase involved in cell wall biosynthesis